MHSWHISKYTFLCLIENQILGGTSINVNSISVLFFKKQHVFIWQYHTITNLCVRTNIAVVLLPIWRLISNFDLKCLRQLNELHHIHVIHKIWKTNRNCYQLPKLRLFSFSSTSIFQCVYHSSMYLRSSMYLISKWKSGYLTITKGMIWEQGNQYSIF